MANSKRNALDMQIEEERLNMKEICTKIEQGEKKTAILFDQLKLENQNKEEIMINIEKSFDSLDKLQKDKALVEVRQTKLQQVKQAETNSFNELLAKLTSNFIQHKRLNPDH